MLERVGLPGAADKRIDELSGGQRQRVAIARSLVLEPTLLLLDEPLGALDLKLREHMKIELKQLQAAFGTTFVYITHDQSEALVLSDHVAVMNHGPLRAARHAAGALLRSRHTPFVAGFVGANNRIAGTARRVDGDIVEVDDARRLARARARAAARSPPATRSRRSSGPEAATLGARRRASCPPAQTALCRRGAEPAVRRRQLGGAAARGARAACEFRIALPQTGRFADLQAGERICFSFDPQRAVCFRAPATARDA